MKGRLVLTVAMALAGCSGPPDSSATPPPDPAADPVQTSTIAGRIVVEGTVPRPEMIRLDADPKCAALEEGGLRAAEDIIVGPESTLQNVFVYVKEGLPSRIYPVPPDSVVLDQQGCRYVPRVLGIQVGQELTVRNSDALLHNVRAEGVINEPFDVGTPIKGMEITRTFVTREVMVPVKCNVHSWMTAYIGVVEHPFFAVSANDGTFSIEGLPPGTYTIEIWHERFGTATEQVTVAARETRHLAFTFKAS